MSPLLAMAADRRKRHTMRVHKLQAVSDRLNPLSLGQCDPPLTLII